MIQIRWHGRSRVAGFTLVEALVATLLMGMILAALATVTAQWLPGWNRGFARVQQTELLTAAIERLAADFTAAEFISANRDTDHPLFEGTELSATFVRSAIGPNTRSGLDFVRISEITDRRGPAMVRARASFAPGAGSIDQIAFDAPVVLLRAPYRLSFSYAGKDGVWKDSWHDSSALPSTVRLIVRDAVSGRTLPVSTMAMVHADLSADCASGDDCDELIGNGKTDVRSESDEGNRSTSRNE
jgi:general secretion pathway protein J